MISFEIILFHLQRKSIKCYYGHTFRIWKTRQISMLLAIARGEKNFSSAAVLKNYNLGTSANVKNLKKAIIDKDLVNVESGTMSIQDPVFKTWLLERYS